MQFDVSNSINANRVITRDYNIWIRHLINATGRTKFNKCNNVINTRLQYRYKTQ